MDLAATRPAPRVFVLDNYDSFTWNLARYFEEFGADLRVELNDAVSVDEILDAEYDAIVVSPGPGRPETAGISLELIRRVAGTVPLLGVCLGHQAIAQAWGGRIVEAPTLMHGKTSQIVHDGSGLFAGLAQGFRATRYHSLVIEPTSLPAGFFVSSRTAEGLIMSIGHREQPLYGVQFHPESILTREGKQLLANFLVLAGARSAGIAALR